MDAEKPQDHSGAVEGGHNGGDGERESAGRVPAGAHLTVRKGFYEGLEVCLDRDWIVIGRGRGADVVIAEPTISRAHAAFGFDTDGFFVQDLGSTNRTLVNGHRAKRSVLKTGDEVQMGKLILGASLPESG